MDAQDDLSVCWEHRHSCRKCCAFAAQMLILFYRSAKIPSHNNFMNIVFIFSLKTLTGFVFVFALLVIGLNYEFPKSTRSIIANISPLQFKEDFLYLRKLWSTAANALNENELYSEDFNVDGVLKALQKATILNVSMEHARTAFKWMFILEGGQRAVFKPRL